MAKAIHGELFRSFDMHAENPFRGDDTGQTPRIAAFETACHDHCRYGTGDIDSFLLSFLGGVADGMQHGQIVSKHLTERSHYRIEARTVLGRLGSDEIRKPGIDRMLFQLFERIEYQRVFSRIAEQPLHFGMIGFTEKQEPSALCGLFSNEHLGLFNLRTSRVDDINSALTQALLDGLGDAMRTDDHLTSGGYILGRQPATLGDYG